MRDRCPGPELDAEIAHRIFGKQIGQCGTGESVRRFVISGGAARDLPPYSTDIAAAWTIDEHLLACGHVVRVTGYPDGATANWHHLDDRAGLRVSCVVEQVVLGIHTKLADAHASSAPLAICRAVLQLR